MIIGINPDQLKETIAALDRSTKNRRDYQIIEQLKGLLGDLAEIGKHSGYVDCVPSEGCGQAPHGPKPVYLIELVFNDKRISGPELAIGECHGVLAHTHFAHAMRFARREEAEAIKAMLAVHLLHLIADYARYEVTEHLFS